MINSEDLKMRVREIVPEIIELRHALHRIPELKLAEYKTAQLIKHQIAGTNVDLLPPYLGTDTVCILEGLGGPQGNNSGRNVTLRADIDALPLQEKSGVVWASEHPGAAHSCGHDGHTAILIGALKVLDSLRENFGGSVRFVFQPAEEELGELGGGRQMVEKGLLDTAPHTSAVFALHGWPDIPLGTVAAGSGAVMAAADRFSITVKGVGGHGARPHLAVDPILTSAQIVSALQSIVSRNISPADPAVVSVCTIHGGHGSNIIPDEVFMEGTTRYFDSKLKEMISTRIEEVIQGICKTAGASYDFKYHTGNIPLVNDPEMVTFAKIAVENVLGKEAWAGEVPKTMGAEDFSYYLDKVPGAFIRLGLGPVSANLHNPAFDFNDKAIETGITVLCALALKTIC